MSDQPTSAIEKPWLMPQPVELLNYVTLLRAFERLGGYDDPKAPFMVSEIDRRGWGA